MLISSHVVSIDAKGRVSIPVRFREYLNATFRDRLILLDMDGCIFAYPQEEWQRRFGDKVQDLPTHRPAVRAHMRRMYGKAVPVEIDKQGRILLPSRLREAAAIDKEAVIVGLENKFEVWGRERWDRMMEEEPGSIGESGEDSGDDLIELEF
ncbi:MAG: division/cell wall cluster transcriptional repressor MraZ [Nitrospinota bacterium]